MVSTKCSWVGIRHLDRDAGTPTTKEVQQHHIPFHLAEVPMQGWLQFDLLLQLIAVNCNLLVIVDAFVIAI